MSKAKKQSATKNAKKDATYADESPIHGKGLFAARKIKKGEVLGTVSGKWTKKDSAYTLWVSEDQGFRVECDFRYINHSKKPNAAYYDTLEVCALRDIKPGEEITHDYGIEGDFE